MRLKTIETTLILLILCVFSACGSESDTAKNERFSISDLDPEIITGSQTLSVKPSEFTDSETLEPRTEGISLTDTDAVIQVSALSKHLVQRPKERLVTLFIKNTSSQFNLKDVVLKLSSSNQLGDYTETPINPTYAKDLEIKVGHIVAQAQAPINISVPSEGESSVQIEVTGVYTNRRAVNSSKIAVSPDGKEVWAFFADAKMVSVVNAETNTRSAQIQLDGSPVALAMSPDGLWVAVTTHDTNKLFLIDAMSREIRYEFDESDGIGREPDHLLWSPDGGQIWISSHVSDQISSIQRLVDGFEFRGQVKVGRQPEGMSMHPSGDRLYVAHFLPRGAVNDNEAWVSIIDTENLTRLDEIVLRDDSNLLESECLSELFGVSASRLTLEGVPSLLRGVYLDPSAQSGWVPGTRIAGANIVWEKGENALDLSDFIQLKDGQLSASFFFLLDTRISSEAKRQRMTEVLDPPDVDIDYFECIHNAKELEFITRDLITASNGEQQVNRGAIAPTGFTGLDETGIVNDVAFMPDGSGVLLLSETSDELVLLDARTLHSRSQRYFTLSGNNPVGIAISPNGERAYVSYRNSLSLSVIDISSALGANPSYIPYEYKDVDEFPSAGGTALTRKRIVRHIKDLPERPLFTELAQVPLVDEDPMDAELRMGAILFSSANPDKYPTGNNSRMGSCEHCHPKGGSDGSLWATMEGERRTMPLFGGTANRGWLHISATHDNAYEFAEIVAPERLAAQLDEEETKALAKYLAFGIPKHQTPVVDQALAERGKELFSANCTSCHQGEKLTSGNPDPDHPYGGGMASGPMVFNVGTATDSAQAILPQFFQSLLPPVESQLLAELRGDRDLGEGDYVQDTLDFRARPNRARGMFKAPALVNLWESNLYFHDGSMRSLKEVVGYFNDFLSLGLSDEDQKALVEYLKTL